MSESPEVLFVLRRVGWHGDESGSALTELATPKFLLKSSSAQTGLLNQYKLVNLCSCPSHWLCTELVDPARLPHSGANCAASWGCWNLSLYHHSTKSRSWLHLQLIQTSRGNTWVCFWLPTRDKMGSEMGSSDTNSSIFSSTSHLPGYTILLSARTQQSSVPQTAQQHTGLSTRRAGMACVCE